jgi:hypothetical protein
MLNRLFLFLGSLHGICDALTLSDIGWRGFLMYGSTVSVVFFTSRYKKVFFFYSVFTIFPAIFHFLKEDKAVPLYFVIPAILHPRLILQTYFIFIHSLSPTIQCCIKARQKSFIGFYLWLLGSIMVPTYLGKRCQKNPFFMDRLLLAVTIPHLLLNDLKLWRR